MSADLKKFITETADILRQQPDMSAAFQKIEQALKIALLSPNLLAPVHKEGCEKDYKRHILHCDPALPVTLLSLVWEPGQESSIHGHHAWCAVGILEGRLTIETFTDHGHKLQQDSCRSAIAGQTCLESPEEQSIHRISNRSDKKAISLHLYGMDLSDDPALINIDYKTETG